MIEEPGELSFGLQRSSRWSPNSPKPLDLQGTSKDGNKLKINFPTVLIAVEVINRLLIFFLPNTIYKYFSVHETKFGHRFTAHRSEHKVIRV